MGLPSRASSCFRSDDRTKRQQFSFELPEWFVAPMGREFHAQLSEDPTHIEESIVVL
jgi:hypothetical protein